MLCACQTQLQRITPTAYQGHLIPRQVLAHSSEFVIVKAGSRDNLTQLAKTFLHNASKVWMIAEFNQIKRVHPGQEVIIPLRSFNPMNIDPHGYQTVPILCYHRFGGAKDRMSVSAKSLDAQMRYLRNHDFHVIPLADMVAFLQGRKQLPRKSVVITIDDGFRSIYDIAFPIFKEYGYPVTVFVYTDFIGAPAALTWKQIKRMRNSGIVDIHSHSKTHANLGLRKSGEPEPAYRRRIQREVVAPHRKIKSQLGKTPTFFAYPYGDTNEVAIGYLEDLNYQLGVTVQPGGNAAFAYPFMLHRSMIYGDHDLTDFAARLQTYRKIP